MANHSLPSVTSTYVNYTSELNARIDDSLKMLDPAATTVTNPPANSIRWNSANSKFEKWSGTAWAVLTSSYAISVSTATTSNNLSGGSVGTIPYQSGNGETAQLASGTNGYFLKCNGASAPSWSSINELITLTNLLDATITSPSNGQVLRYNGSLWVNSSYEYTTTIEW